ncbi:MAG: rhodanese-like domain-containing protein [Alphaproteobacteria bacterium]|nr:rhodanese-like domain-containing protein [Alphaproteobacteria bacterium]
MTKFFNRRSFFLAVSGLVAAITSLPRLLRRSGGRGNETKWIEPEILATALDEKADWILLDVRNPDEFSGPMGHIPGARNLPVEQLVSAPSNLGLPPDKRIVMVCLTDKRSARAAQVLGGAGFGRVFVLRGGMQRWSEEGRPVEQATILA